MAVLNAQVVKLPSTTPAYGAVSASDTCLPTDRMFLIVKNASGSADTCVVVIPGNTEFGQAQPDVSITVPATNGERWIPITPNMADPATGMVTVTHTQTTSVTCALVRM